MSSKKGTVTQGRIRQKKQKTRKRGHRQSVGEMATEVDESSRGKISIFIASYRLSRVLGGVSGSGALWRGVESSARCSAPPITRLMYWLVTDMRVGGRKH